MMSNRIWFLILFLIVKLLLYSQVDITDINITPNLYTKENSVFIHPDNRNIKVVGGQENRLLLLALSSTN